MTTKEMLILLQNKTKEVRKVTEEKDQSLVLFPKGWNTLFESRYVKFTLDKDNKVVYVEQTTKEDKDDILLNKTRNRYIRIPKEIMDQLFYPDEFVLKMHKGLMMHQNYLTMKISDSASGRLKIKKDKYVQKKIKEEQMKRRRDLF